MSDLMQKFGVNAAGKDYVVGDIHGCYTLLMDTLAAIGFDKKADRLFSVGDLVDRGPESHKCLSLPYEPWFFGVRGNHEILMHEAVNGGNMGLWLVNGGGWCLQEDWNDLQILVNDVMNQLPLAIEVSAGGARVGIIHADVTSGVWGDFNEQRDVWSRDRIGSSAQDWKPVQGIDTVIVGHSILDEVTERDNLVYIDTGAFHTGKLQVIALEDLI